MKTYPIPMVPGPTSVPESVFNAYKHDFGSSDTEPEFLELYNETEANLQKLLLTREKVVIMTGEGMIVLWAALKSCLLPGDKVLAVSTGLFGSGIGEMAAGLGAQVETVTFPSDETVHDWDMVEKKIAAFQPKMITVVHCETPSGTLNPVKQLGELKKKYGVPLLYTDAVASAGGAELRVDDWHIDLLLGGSQKCLSVPPGMSFLTVSRKAWEIVERVRYAGYDAIQPFATAQRDFYFPYTPYWHGVSSLNQGVLNILEEGLEQSWQRHQTVADHVRRAVVELGYELFPKASAIQSPTVTAIKVPSGRTWHEFDDSLRARGLGVGGNYGELAGKVFRLGHMGTQASMELADKALAVLAEVR